MSFFFRHLFYKKETDLSLVIESWIQGIENNCEMTLEPGFWFEMPSKCSFSVSPKDHWLLTGTSWAVRCQHNFPSINLCSSRSPPRGSIWCVFSKKDSSRSQHLHFQLTFHKKPGLSGTKLVLEAQPTSIQSSHTCGNTILVVFRVRIKPSKTYSSAWRSQLQKLPSFLRIQKADWHNSWFRPQIKRSELPYKVTVHSVGG